MDKKKLTKEDLPKELVEEMEKAIREDPQMVKLETKKREQIRKGMYIQAQNTKEMMNRIVDRVINDYLSTYKGEVVRMDELLKGMSEKDREDINVLSNCIVAMCDMIETFTMDCNSILHKYHPDFNIEMYDKLIEMGREAKVQMDFMAKNTDMMYQCTFADFADDITVLVKNKVKSLVRKLRQKKEAKND